MFKHILVPLDGSRLAEAVLPVVAHLGQALEAVITLVHVIEIDAPPDIHGEHHLREEAEACDYLAQIADNSFPPGIKVQRHVHAEKVKDVAASIVTHAGEYEPDLIVMCSHGKGGWRDFVVGSIAQQVIAHGKTPVLLIQPQAGETRQYTFDPILVALDGDPEHERGLLPGAAGLAKKLGSALRLLTVVPTLGTLSGGRGAAGRLLPGTATVMLELSETSAAEHLQAEANLLQAQGLAVSCGVARGDPAQQIVVAAESCQAGLVVLGTHGRAGMKAFWAGSVASKVITGTTIPFLLIPAVKHE